MADETEGLSSEGIPEDLEKGLAAAAGSASEATENEVNREPEVEAFKPGEETQTETASTETKTVEPAEDWKKRHDELNARIVDESNKLAERGFNEFIRRKAVTSAAAYEALTGEKPPPDMFPAAPKAPDPNAKPEDALKAEVAELKAWRAGEEKRAKEAEAKAKYDAHVQTQVQSLYAATEKHKDVYEHPHFGEQMTALLTSEFLKVSADPKAVVDPAKLAEDVAKKFKAAIEWEKQKYVGSKKEVAKTVPAGAGPGGGRQAGPAKVEADLGSRRGRAALAKAMGEFAATED